MAATSPNATSQQHNLERTVRRELLASKNVEFASLVVRRVSSDGICLQGVMHVENDGPDEDTVESIIRKISGIDSVLNHLVVQPKVPSR